MRFLFRQLILLFSNIGGLITNAIWKIGSGSKFFVQIILNSHIIITKPRLLLNEIFFSGTLSLIIIVVSGLFVGLVLGLQGFETLKRFGATEAVGSLVALSLVRELGPVTSALLFSARAGSAITAKVGIMKSSEQFSAMELLILVY